MSEDGCACAGSRCGSGRMPDERDVEILSELFKILGDGTRLKILHCLWDSELCVRDICEPLGMSMSAVSHQLRVLRDSNLVRVRRDGRNSYYSLSDDHVKTILETATEHIGE